MYERTIGDFLDWCYNDPSNSLSCDTRATFCYCSSNESYFLGNLATGNYRLKIYDLSAQKLNVQVTYRAPTSPYRNKQVGGIRIKSVKDHDLNGQLVAQRDYDYNDHNGYSTGILMNNPIYYKVYEYYNYPYSGNPCNGTLGRGVHDNEITTYVVVNSVLNSPISREAQGSHIGYSSVKETYRSAAGVSDDYALVTDYHNQPVNYDPAKGNYGFLSSYGVIPSVTDWCTATYTAMRYMPGILTKSFETRNGKPLVQRFYDSSDDLVREVVNSYDLRSDGSVGALKLFFGAVGHDPIDPTTSRTVISGVQAYNFNVESFVLTGSNTTDFVDDGDFMTSVTFSYNDDWQQVNRSSTNSEGITTHFKSYFPTDFTAVIPYVDALRQKNILSVPIKIEVLKGNEQVNGRIIEYNELGLTTNIKSFESDVPIVPPPIDDLSVSQYVSQGDLSYYTGTTRVKEFIPRSGVPITYLWGYDNRYVVAKVEGVTFNIVDGIVDPLILNNPLNDQQLSTELQKLRDAVILSHFQITTYTIDPLWGATSLTDPNGQVTAFEYDQFGRFRMSRDHDQNILQLNEYYLNNQ